MSHAATLSPSPIQFRTSATTNLSVFFNSRYSPVVNNNRPSLLERRRTVHPHNTPIQRPADMPNRSHSQNHPRLEHRASQTVIDLTEEPEDALAPARNGGDHDRPQRPPQLGRSDALNIGDYIDLTDDADEDPIVTRERTLPPRRSIAVPRIPAPQPPQPRANGRPESPSLFLPAAAPRSIHRVFSAAHNSLRDVLFGPARFDAPAQAFGQAQVQMNHAIHNQDLFNRIQFLGHDDFQVPGRMDYRQPAFNNQKPVHEAPKPARKGFTRSPTEDDVVICPSCEQELVHNKETDEPVAKRGGKAPTRKDREEHPFWVVKECGHVYCNNCFQHRGPPGKHGLVAFPESIKTAGKRGSKSIACAVENCESDVKSKDKWVGLFL